jgi:hypothetical protein
MSAKRLAIPALLGALTLAGCGTYVPEIRDFPNNGTSAQNNQLVQAILVSVRCEIQDAVTKVINADLESGRINGSFAAQFLRGWGAQVALTLQLEEKSAINPNGVYAPLTPLTSLFTLSAGFEASADATRIDKVNYKYKVSDLYLGPGGRRCIRDENPPRDSLLIQSDLKLGEWLSAMINGTATNIITSVGKENVLSHQVTFEVITSGDITPAWKLVTGSINQSGTFLAAKRDRTHDLVITFGPLDGGRTGNFLIPIAESTHIQSQLSSGITTGFKSVVRR